MGFSRQEYWSGLPLPCPTLCEELTHLKRPWIWERLKAGKEGNNRKWDGWMTSQTWWTWVWASSRSWWWTGYPVLLQSMGSQRVGRDRVTEMFSNLDMLLQTHWCLNCRKQLENLTKYMKQLFHILHRRRKRIQPWEKGDQWGVSYHHSDFARCPLVQHLWEPFLESGVLLTWQGRKGCLGECWWLEFELQSSREEDAVQRKSFRDPHSGPVNSCLDPEMCTCRDQQGETTCSHKRPDQANTWGSEMSGFPSTSVGDERLFNSLLRS